MAKDISPKPIQIHNTKLLPLDLIYLYSLDYFTISSKYGLVIMFLSNEVYRKILHLSFLWIVVVYNFFGYEVIARLLLVTLVVFVGFEWSRSRDNGLGEWCRMILDKTNISKIMREDEVRGFIGSTRLVFIAYIMLYLIPTNVYLVAFTTLMISDAVAALVGIKYGEVRLCGKSLEGSIAFLLSAVFISFGWWYVLEETYTFLFVMLVAAGVATIMELCSKKMNVDDNLLIPVSYAIVAWIYDSMLAVSRMQPW